MPWEAVSALGWLVEVRGLTVSGRLAVGRWLLLTVSGLLGLAVSGLLLLTEALLLLAESRLLLLTETWL